MGNYLQNKQWEILKEMIFKNTCLMLKRYHLYRKVAVIYLKLFHIILCEYKQIIFTINGSMEC